MKEIANVQNLYAGYGKIRKYSAAWISLCKGAIFMGYWERMVPAKARCFG